MKDEQFSKSNSWLHDRVSGTPTLYTISVWTLQTDAFCLLVLNQDYVGPLHIQFSCNALGLERCGLVVWRDIWERSKCTAGLTVCVRAGGVILWRLPEVTVSLFADLTWMDLFACLWQFSFIRTILLTHSFKKFFRLALIIFFNGRCH